MKYSLGISNFLEEVSSLSHSIVFLYFFALITEKGFLIWAWQPTPVFLPGESHGQRILVGYSPWGCKESDTTEWLTLSLFPLQNLPQLSLPAKLYSQSWSCTPDPSEHGQWFTYTPCPASCCSHIRALPSPSALHCAQASYYLQCSCLDFILKTLNFLLETSLEPQYLF